MRNRRMRQVTEWAVVFVAAIVMWFFVISDENPLIEKKIDVPLQYKNVGDGLAIVEPRDGIRITVRATRERINDVRSSEFDAFVDLKGMHEGNHSLRANVVAPEKIEVIDDGGDQNVRLEQAVEKQILLEISRTTENPKSYLIKNIIKPDFIIIKGAKENVYSVVKAVAEIDLGKINSTTTFDITPKLFTATGAAITEGVQISPQRVAVVVNMFEEKEVKLVADTIGKISNTTVFLNPMRIKIFGNNDDIAKIDSISTSQIDVKEFATGKNMTVKLIIPKNIQTVAGIIEVNWSLIKGNN
ncbi:MAG: CdaR family protein [Bacillota bacterium]